MPGHDTFQTGQAYVRSRVRHTTWLISQSSTGVAANGEGVFNPTLSRDGTVAAFDSDATNLVPELSNGTFNVFTMDLPSRHLEQDSVSATGGRTDDFSFNPSLSATGRFVAFTSATTNLVPGGVPGHVEQVYLRDRTRNVTVLVSRRPDGNPADKLSTNASVSADGRYVAFGSAGTNLVPGDTNGQGDIFVRDMHTGVVELVSVASDGAQGNGGSGSPRITGDGRYVAFDSYASNLVRGDTNGQDDVFVHDRLTGSTVRVSITSDGQQALDGPSYGQTISDDGRLVAFTSYAANLVPADSNGHSDAFVHDLAKGRTRLVSRSSTGVQGDDQSGACSISADGRFLALESSADNLVPNDTNASEDTFVKALQP